LHFGLAGGAFHHFIYLPFRAGIFAKPLSHKVEVAKSGLAALFVYHELKLAAADVRSSKLLSALFAPITALASKVSALRSSLINGKPTPTEMAGVQNDGNAIARSAQAAGQPVTQATPQEIAAAGGPMG
jgi:hypothetical protein